MSGEKYCTLMAKIFSVKFIKTLEDEASSAAVRRSSSPRLAGNREDSQLRRLRCRVPGHIHISPLKAFAQTWCAANPSLGYDTPENVESYACNYVDCSSIHSRDPCSVPSNLFSRASFAMNAYYQKEHDCTFGGSGLKSITDPSYESCKFVGSEEMISAPAALSKWCIAKPTAPYSLLQRNIDFACTQVDCSVIQTGGECQLVDTVMNHASVAMNLFYRASKRTDSSCHFNSTGMIVIEDPSFGTCLYERKGED